ncbi:FtsX-like permease family protein [Streptomyces sp. NPDC048349]|uniref:FtsX-like permease family protein n=1 Tax=Streptomyces sp. NPDC048349 TaxID=3155486 RepID=UPI00343DFD63
MGRVMWQLSVRSVRHHAPLFLGTFVSLVLGVALIAVSSAALAATFDVRQPSPEGRPSITLEDGRGTAHTLVSGGLDLGGIQTVLVMAGIVSAFVTVFVIAGTCAFSVALRRQDMGLLRLVGAGAKQVRRMVIGESVAVAVPAVAVGCLLAAVAAPWAVDALNSTGLSPAELRAGSLGGPLLIAAASGLVMAVLGAMAASRRASRVGATEALREAVLDSRAMTGGRWVSGLLLLAVGAVMVGLAPQAGLEGSVPLALFGSMALTLAASSLGPAYLPALTRLLAAPVRRSSSVAARLAVESLGTSKLRTASLVGPVLAIVAVVGVFTSVLSTTGATIKSDDRSRTLGQLVVEGASGGPLPQDVLAGLRADPRVRAVSAPAGLELAVADRTSVRQDRGAAADLPALARTHRVDVVEGAVTELGPGQAAVSREYAEWYGYHVGTRLTYGLFGGRPATAEVTAVLDGGTAVPHVVLAAGVPGAPEPGRATVLLDPASAGAARTVARELTTRLGADRVRVTETGQWFARSSSGQERLNMLVLVVLAGPASAYALISVASTLVMSYSRRTREFADMRLVGVSEKQLRSMALWETGCTTTVAAVVATAVVASGLQAYRAALRVTYDAVPLSVPWGALSGLVLACVAVSATVGLLATRRLLGKAGITMATTRQ